MNTIDLEEEKNDPADPVRAEAPKQTGISQ